MAKSKRAAKTTSSTLVTPSSPSVAPKATRYKRKATTVAATSPMGTVKSTPAISPAPKKRRFARLPPDGVPLPTVSADVVKEIDVVVEHDPEDDDEEEDDDDSNFGGTVDHQIQPDLYLPPKYADRVHVLVARGETFDALLTRACVYQNQNEFVLLQALESDEHDFFVWTRSGTVGAVGETQLDGPWKTRRQAIAKFRSLFLSNTLVYWDDRHTHTFGDGGYTWIEANQATSDTVDLPPPSKTTRRQSKSKRTQKSKPKPVTELCIQKSSLPSTAVSPPSRLDDQVRSFLAMILDASSQVDVYDTRYSALAPQQGKKSSVNAHDGEDGGLDDMIRVPVPLGLPSRMTLQRGFRALNRIHDALTCKADRTTLTHLNSRFYSTVPHLQLTMLDSIRRLADKVEMLVALSVHGGHHDLLAPDITDRYFITNHLDVAYEDLKCRLFPLLPTSREYGLVHGYIANSHCCVTQQGTRGPEDKIVTVFRVEKPDEAVRFAPYRTAANRRILWHGSRMCNWVSILTKGLLITPPGVQLNGSSLGAGIYFTDKIAKAMGYSHPSFGHQVFLLSEVALGQCRPSGSRGAPSNAGSAAVHSCHGVGRCVSDAAEDYVDALGATWPIGKATQSNSAGATHGHNEFVVFNPAQARMRYVVVTQSH